MKREARGANLVEQLLDTKRLLSARLLIVGTPEFILFEILKKSGKSDVGRRRTYVEGEGRVEDEVRVSVRDD